MYSRSTSEFTFNIKAYVALERHIYNKMYLNFIKFWFNM